MAKKSKAELELAKLKKRAAAAKKKIKEEVRSAPPSRSYFDGTLRSLARRNELASYGGSAYADFMKGLARKMPEGTLPFVNEEKVKLSIRKGPSAKQKAEANRIKASQKKGTKRVQDTLAKKASKGVRLTDERYKQKQAEKRAAQTKANAEAKARSARVVRAPGKTTGKKASSGPYKGLTLSQRLGAEGAKVKRRIARERKSSTLSGLVDKYVGPRRLKRALGIGQPKTSTPARERDELLKRSKPTAKKAKASAPVKAQASAPAKPKRKTLRDVLVKPKAAKPAAPKPKRKTLREVLVKAPAKAAPAKAASLKGGGLFGTLRRVAGKTKAPAKAASLKGAPRPELPKKSDPEYKTKLSKFRKWYTANRSSPKKKAVAQPVIKPAKKAVVSKKTTPSRTADLTGLQKRIAMKRESGQAIPAAWLKAEKTAKAKARVAKAAQSSKRIPSSIDRQENQKEAARGRKEMAARKARLSADADRRVTRENLAEVQRGRKEMSERKANVAGDKARRKTQRQAQLDPLIVAKQKADVARDKTATEERVVRMRKDAAARAKRKKMQAKMSALPGFRSN